MYYSFSNNCIDDRNTLIICKISQYSLHYRKFSSKISKLLNADFNKEITFLRLYYFISVILRYLYYVINLILYMRVFSLIYLFTMEYSSLKVTLHFIQKRHKCNLHMQVKDCEIIEYKIQKLKCVR